MLKKIILPLSLLFLQQYAAAQNKNPWYALHHFSGGIESNNQYYFENKKSGILLPEKRFASNTYLNLNYQYQHLEAGIQLEGYNPVLQGYPTGYDGNQLVHGFIRYKSKYAEITAGTFYDQFGAGLLFRAYEERQLGIDNGILGGHLKLIPVKAIRFKAFAGRQRNFMDLSPARLIAGADAEFDIIAIEKDNNQTHLNIGGSYVYKKQEVTVPLPNFPDHITALGARINFSRNNYSASAEYVNKSIEPDFQNKYIYKKGAAFLLNQSYSSSKGWGINLSLRRLENMDFKSNYVSTESVTSLNYLPALTKQHSYLVSNIYPHNTQWLQEIGGQLDINYHFAKNSPIGGAYGAKFILNAALYNALDTTRLSGNQGFSSKALSFGKEKYFRDINLSFEKRWTAKVKGSFSYQHLFYNKAALQGGPYGSVDANILIADFLFKIKEEQSLRTEIQHLFTKDDEKNWYALLAEYSFSNGLSFYASNLSNYQSKKINYFNVGSAYNHNSLRLSLGYAKQRGGLVCVGGVCRFVPTYLGFTGTLAYNF